MNMIVEKQDSVMRLKSEVESEIQKDLDQARADLKREWSHRKAEKERFEKQIKDLQGKVDELQKKLKKYTAGFGSTNDKSSVIRSYESKIGHLQQEHDQKIADLIKQFDREKHSALDIMKTRIKSEINLLVPKIRGQCQQAFNQALVRCQEETATRYREKYGSVIRRMKEEHQAEKRFIQKQAKETADHEKTEWQRRIKAKYEMKALELRNDCERKLIERMRKPGNVSFMLSESPNDASYGSSDISFL
jgi:chromosome segregation ATPase